MLCIYDIIFSMHSRQKHPCIFVDDDYIITVSLGSHCMRMIQFRSNSIRNVMVQVWNSFMGETYWWLVKPVCIARINQFSAEAVSLKCHMGETSHRARCWLTVVTFLEFECMHHACKALNDDNATTDPTETGQITIEIEWNAVINYENDARNHSSLSIIFNISVAL